MDDVFSAVVLKIEHEHLLLVVECYAHGFFLNIQRKNTIFLKTTDLIKVKFTPSSMYQSSSCGRHRYHPGRGSGDVLYLIRHVPFTVTVPFSASAEGGGRR